MPSLARRLPSPSALFLLLALAACSGKRADPEHPVVLVGFDGLEWSVARPLLRAGRMPHLRGLIERGVAGSLVPERGQFKSPVLWTSIATGKPAGRHGIVDFLNPDHVPYTSESRRGKALWNIVSDYGLEVLCVGYWVTWPAEPVQGLMVAPYSAAGQNDFNWKGNLNRDLEGQTWPPELLEQIWPIAEEIERPQTFAAVAARYFGDLDPATLPDDERELVTQTLWSVKADETYGRIATTLLRREGFRPDLSIVYFGGTDVAAHRFWRYMEPDRFDYPIDPAAIARFGDVVETFYVEADRLLGEVLAAAPADANVIVCSDHGFHAAFTEKPHPTGVSGHHYDGPPGVLVMAGPDVRHDPAVAGALLGDGPVPGAGWMLDLAPVVLTLLDVPAGRDMENPDGGALARFALPKEVRERAPLPVPTHDEGFRPPKAPTKGSDRAVGEFEEWLNQLGYLGGAGTEETEAVPEGK